MPTITTQKPTRKQLNDWLNDALQQLAYWRTQAKVRTHPTGIKEAKAQVWHYADLVATRVAALAEADCI